MFARVVVGSLVLHEAGGYIPPPPGHQTGRYVAKSAAGRNQGNRTRNRQVLSEIFESASVARKPGVEDRRNRTDRATERNGTERTVLRRI